MVPSELEQSCLEAAGSFELEEYSIVFQGVIFWVLGKSRSNKMYMSLYARVYVYLPQCHLPLAI